MGNLTRLLVLFVSVVIGSSGIQAIAQSTVAENDGTEQRLFAVEIKVGPNWDPSKSAGEQAYFREHSANLKRLRDEGHIVLGARYSDIGLVIFTARSAQDVEGMMAMDPSMSAGTFVFEVHEFNVFFPGHVAAD